MFKFFVTIIFTLYCTAGFAKKNDSLFAIIKDTKLVITHVIEEDDDVFLLAGKYHVPPAVLADYNEVSYKTPLKKGNFLYIPLGTYNYLHQVSDNRDARILYYKVNAADNLSVISNVVGVTQATIQDWNNMPDNSIHAGLILKIGWVLYSNMDKEDRNLENLLKSKQGKKKKSVIPEGIRATMTPEELAAMEAQSEKELYGKDSVSEEELLYLSQTNHGMVTANDKGTAVFFDMPGKVKNGKYYAFHNFAKRGAIIKIYNPGTGQTVFAKVLGPIPQGQKFYNCIIGISAGAKKKLGTQADRMWCELSYVPY